MVFSQWFSFRRCCLCSVERAESGLETILQAAPFASGDTQPIIK